MCVYSADIYDPRSDRSDHIYQEIYLENHSSANSLENVHGRKKIVTTPSYLIPDMCGCPKMVAPLKSLNIPLSFDVR